MSSQNVGEEITGLYLQTYCSCDFVQYNLYTPHVQGEIDVVAVSFAEQTAYICEVAVHLVTGLQYVKERRPDTTARLIKKFTKDIVYAKSAFPDYRHVFMLWSPIVKSSSNPTYDQMKHVNDVRESILRDQGVEIELIINDRYQERLQKLRDYASTRTEELKSPVLRLLQIEQLLSRHLARKPRRTSDGKTGGSESE